MTEKTKSAPKRETPKRKTAPKRPPAPKGPSLDERVARLERAFVTHLGVELGEEERTPGGPAGDGAGEEQIAGNA